MRKSSKASKRELGSLIPFYGHYGCGKTTLLRYFYISWLETREDIYVRHFDGDNPTDKLQEFAIDYMMQKYGNRFEYYGKQCEYLDLYEMYEEEMIEIIKLQKIYPQRNYIIVVDNLKNFTRKNRRGFIDTNHLYHLEKQFQSVGGTTLLLHHTNKQGDFADSKDIVNFADLAYSIKFHVSTNAIIVEPDKQSRYKVEPKAFFVDPISREITHEIDYRLANVSIEEIKIITHVNQLLDECGAFNQQELEKETRIFRNNMGIGDKRFRALLKKYDGKSWNMVKSTNNSWVFTSLTMPNLPNLPSNDVSNNLTDQMTNDNYSNQDEEM